MSAIGYILLSTFVVAACSLVGIGFIFLKKDIFGSLILTLVALSAGAMLGNVAFHLLPETFWMIQDGRMTVFIGMSLFLGAFVLSFVFERLFVWHHCHSASHQGMADCAPACSHRVEPFAQLVLVSDVFHNFIDGLVIAASYIVSPALGFATTAAVLLHEVPQELGDYAVLVHGGYTKWRALLANYLSAITVIVGGVVGYYISTAVDVTVPILLPFAAGGFLYIAAADLLPELKHEEDIGESLMHTGFFFLGIVLMALTAFFE